MGLAERLQQYGENVAAAIDNDPPARGAEREWMQQQARDAQADAAALSDNQSWGWGG